MAANTEVQKAVAGWPCLTPAGLRLRFTPVAPSAKQAAFLALINREALYGGSAGAGKMLDLSTVVLSTKGWTTMGELQVGDVVFDHDGQPTRVLWKSPVRTPTTYRVTMSDGEVIHACDDHLWNVADERQRANYQHTNPRRQATRRARRPSRGLTDEQRAAATDGRARGTALALIETNARRAVEARESAERPSVWDYTTTMTTEAVRALQGAERKRVAIPNGAPLHAPGAWRSDVPPYTLGVWLGDGRAADGSIYTCEADRAALTAELAADGWTVEVVGTVPAASSLTATQDFHRLKLTRDGRTLGVILRAEGLLGNKHVPDWVHLAPHADRQAFLGGFCDTDGTVDRRGRVEFCLAREDMVRDVHSLFWGIGEKPSRVTERVTRNQVEGFTGVAWRFSIARCSQYLFRLPRKRDRLSIDRGCGSRNEYRSIESIEEVDPRPMQCITVDNPRGLYRVGRSHLTTHNSAALLMAALMFCDVPGYNALILRRTLTDLKLPDGLIDVSHDWLSGTGAKYNANDYRWTFPKPNGDLEGGAVLQFGYLSTFGSETRYKSSQYQGIFWDELTEFPWVEQYLYLMSRLRSSVGFHPPAADGLTVDRVPLRFRAATNPGGIGGDWVRKRFVASDTAIRPFLPGKVYDNPGLNAEEYLLSLAELPEVERRRLQDGDWDVLDIPGALWRYDDLAWTDRTEPKPVTDVDVRAMAIDPAVTDETGKGDETGILIGSLTRGDLAVELDLSGRMHPDDWARLAVAEYHKWGCSSVIVEDNQGKALLHGALGNAADQLGLPRPNLAVITAKESKEARAIPVAQAYRSTPRRVYHDLTIKGGRLESQLCLVAGTPVLTRRGWESVESVKVGDEVLTRRGWRAVDWSGATGVATTLTTIRLSTGESITCTPNHPLWVHGVGWVRADTVAQGARLLGCHESPSWNTLESPTGECASTPTHWPATATVARRASTTAPTSSPTSISCSTDSSGRTLTAPSPTATSSTIATATHSTTPSTTLNCSPEANTSATTRRADRPSTPTPTPRRSAPRRCGPNGSPETSSAWPAEPSSSPPGCEPCSAPVHVVAATTWTCAATDVYDLSVAGEHEFYAAGVLVHNTSWVPRRPTTKIPSPDRLDALVWLVRHLLWNEGKSATYRTPRTGQGSVASRMMGKMPGV